MSEVIHASHNKARAIAADEAAKAAAGKADKSTTYTKEEVDAAIAAAKPSDYEQVKAQVEANAQDIANIDDVIPSQATENNQLADKAFVNSSIATNTATFRGSYNAYSELSVSPPYPLTPQGEVAIATAIVAKLASLVPPVVPENNDYCFVQIPRNTQDPDDFDPTVIDRIDRYKCTVEDGVSSWDYEWSLNNSSFTADQWAAINSGITSALVTKLGALPTAQELATALLAKYEKPSTGIPKTDLSAGVQASLDKADSALQTAPVSSINNKTGAVTLDLNDVCPEYENWLGVPGTTAAGKSIKVLAKTVNGVIEGGMTVTGSSSNNNNTTKYRYGSVTVTRNGVVTEYLFDSSQYGIARLVDILVKSVKLNGTALTPDSNGAVDVPALPLTGGKISGKIAFGSGQAGIFAGAGGLDILDDSGQKLWVFYGNGPSSVARLDDLTPYAPLASPAFTGTPTAPTPTAGDNSTKVATTAFVKTAVDGVPLRYDMPSSVALVADNDEATLVCADKAVTNATIADGFSTLNLTFPDAVSGKVRDFYLRIVVAAGESAPALSIPQGITIENPGGSVPEIADGETSAAATTLVWFSETAPNVFTAKSETVKAVA